MIRSTWKRSLLLRGVSLARRPAGRPAAFAGACRISHAVTNSSLHRVNPTVVSTSDDQPTLKGSAYDDQPTLKGSANSDLFAAYGRHRAYDEMFGRSGEVRAHCLPLYEELQGASPGQLGELQLEADKAFLTQGITFTVYGDEQGTERIFPFDLVPRLITAPEWQTLERGLTQRLTAINLFLKDVYHEGRILAEGVVPRELVQSCRHFRREMRGVPVQGDIYVSVAGTDLVRGEDGHFVVLEDNLRVPSGVSYMLANRDVTKRVMPALFDRYRVRPIAQYGQLLLATLRALAPPASPEPTFVVLTPGVGNSAYFEHAFLAREVGIALV